MKNLSIWISVCKDIKEQNKERKIDCEEREKIIQLRKIKLIYASKLKSNVIG